MRSSLILPITLIAWLILAQSCMTFRKADSEMKKEFKEKGVVLTTATEKISKKNIHFAKTGNDTFPTIIFIHGTPGSWEAFAGYMKDKELLQHFRMISIDRPGFGYSDFGDALHLQKQSQLITPLLYQLDNGKPLFLAGHSMGGPMIVKLAADNPTLFAGLIIISGAEDPAEEKPEKWRPWLFRTPLNLFVPGAFRPSNEELWYLKKDLVRLKDEFRKVSCPVYFIHGEKDSWVPPGNVEYAKKLLVNSSHVDITMLPGANHFIPWTKYGAIKNIFLHLSFNNNGSLTPQ